MAIMTNTQIYNRVKISFEYRLLRIYKRNVYINNR